ncbi:MAG: hypothetical protein EHM72_03925, partial [Calditrichaeota bacterium]
MKNLIYFFLPLLFSTAGVNSQSVVEIHHVSQPVINLNGVWEICQSPGNHVEDYFKDHLEWQAIQVPGECMMQGLPIRHDVPFLYRKLFSIPAEYAGKTILIRFEGVYSYARVWINSRDLGDHYGGFTVWERDITQHVNPGETAQLCVLVVDRADEISYGSGYAKHPIGGILRNVSIMAVPDNYPQQVSITTD